jgi:hypothetical protein
VRGLANCKRSTASSNGMEAKSSAGVPLSSPAAAQRCAEGAGLDSGTAAEAQSALPSIAFPAATAADRPLLSTNAAAPAAPQLQSRISTSLTDVTLTRRWREMDSNHRSRSRDTLVVGRLRSWQTESRSAMPVDRRGLEVRRTRRWRETDSNPRSLQKDRKAARFSASAQATAGFDQLLRVRFTVAKRCPKG